MIDLMPTPNTKRRRLIARCSFTLALVFLAWLPLGILQIIPFVFELQGEPRLRVHAAAAVGCLMIAAWGFWES
jgi:hypothetical protein